MTTETQTQNQGSLVSKLIGVATGASATLACLYNPTLTPLVAGTAASVAAVDGRVDGCWCGLGGVWVCFFFFLLCFLFML